VRSSRTPNQPATDVPRRGGLERCPAAREVNALLPPNTGCTSATPQLRWGTGCRHRPRPPRRELVCRGTDPALGGRCHHGHGLTAAPRSRDRLRRRARRRRLGRARGRSAGGSPAASWADRTPRLVEGAAVSSLDTSGRSASPEHRPAAGSFSLGPWRYPAGRMAPAARGVLGGGGGGGGVAVAADGGARSRHMARPPDVVRRTHACWRSSPATRPPSAAGGSATPCASIWRPRSPGGCGSPGRLPPFAANYSRLQAVDVSVCLRPFRLGVARPCSSATTPPVWHCPARRRPPRLRPGGTGVERAGLVPRPPPARRPARPTRRPRGALQAPPHQRFVSCWANWPWPAPMCPTNREMPRHISSTRTDAGTASPRQTPSGADPARCSSLRSAWTRCVAGISRSSHGRGPRPVGPAGTTAGAVALGRAHVDGELGERSAVPAVVEGQRPARFNPRAPRP